MSKVLVFAGSNHSQSINQELAFYAAELLSMHSVNKIRLTDYNSPMFSLDMEVAEGHPKQIIELEQLIAEHEGIILALPEYNGSMTSFFKNTLDWLSRVNREFLKDKKMLLLSTSPGKYGAKFGLEHTASILPRFGCEVIGTFSLGNFYEVVNNSDGFELNNEEAFKELKEKIDAFEKSL